MPRIDLNADVGEGLGTWPIGDDERLIPLVTSANIACGAHAGDPVTIERTVALAVHHGVAVGAHPGYPDPAGFGRRDLDMTPAELRASVIHQVGGVAGFARAAGVPLRHVKAHGALYNRMARDASIAEVVARAVAAVVPDAIFVALAGSVALDAGRAAGLRVAAEAFADRAYEPDGSLRSRRLDDAILATAEAAAAQAVRIAREGRVLAHDGTEVAVHADTICIHGDTPDAAAYAAAIRAALGDAGVTVAGLPA